MVKPKDFNVRHLLSEIHTVHGTCPECEEPSI